MAKQAVRAQSSGAMPVPFILKAQPQRNPSPSRHWVLLPLFKAATCLSLHYKFKKKNVQMKLNHISIIKD